MFSPASASVTRRRMLLGVVGGPLLLSLGACTDDQPPPPPPDPDREALEAARDVEAEVLASMEGWDARTGESSVTPPDARTVVIAHVTALDEALGTTPTPTPSPTGSVSFGLVPAPSTQQVVALIDDAADEHTRALRTASPEISPLLASIAASDASLAAAIRRSS